MGLRSGIRRVLAASPARRLIWTEPRFVIVGTGRSGTRYIAEVLTAAGVKTGHEQWWNPRRSRASRLNGEASWIATFQLDGYQGHVFHQIRDPLDTIRSIAAVETAPHRVNNQWGLYRQTIVTLTGDPIIDAMTVADTWIQKSEEIAEWTYRLEDVSADLLVELGARAGLRVDHRRAQAAIKMVPTTTHTMTGAKRETFEFGWDDMPDGETKQRLVAHAERYGYHLPHGV